MRKRYNKFNYDDGLYKLKKSRQTEKTRKKYNKKSIKFFMYSLLVFFLLVIGYILYSSVSAANDVFAGSITLDNLIGKSSLKQTDGITNVLFLGKGGSNHPGGQLTDTIMLVRLRHKDQKIAMVSIPRDLYVTIPNDGQAKINQAYAVGFNSKKESDERDKAGAELASKVVSNVTGVPVHYYITADFTGFKEVVDAIGGITVNVEKELYDPMYPNEGFTKSGEYYKTDAYEPLLVKAGIQKMDGELALKYVRSRHGTGVSDFDRAYRQQQVLYAVKDKALSLGVLANPKKVSGILAGLGNHIRVSMSPSELYEFLEKFSEVGEGSIINKVLDNSEDGLLVSSNNGSSILLPKGGNFNQIHNFVENIFDEITLKEVEVEIYNASEIAGKARSLAEKLKKAGINVTVVDDYDTQLDRTVIQDGTGGGEVFKTISKYVSNYKTEKLDQEGKVVIIIGLDDGN